MVKDDAARSEFTENAPAMRIALERVRKLCGDSARLLSASLVGQTLSAWGDSTTRSVGVQSYIRETGQLLSLLPSALKGFQEQRRDRLAAIDAIQERTKAVLRSSSEIEEVGVKLKLLALNARIESAHAGEMGTGFDVVATEVGNLANQVLALTHRIAAESADTSRALEEGHSVLLAQSDGEADFGRDLESRIARIAEDLKGMDPRTGGPADLHALTEEVSRAIEVSVRALQFDDLVSQLVTDVLSRMDTIREAHGMADEVPSETAYRGPVSQDSMEPGSFEFF